MCFRRQVVTTAKLPCQTADAVFWDNLPLIQYAFLFVNGRLCQAVVLAVN